MPSSDRDIREEQIATAAYHVLAERGYSGASMLAIAKEAKASNETLYRWYGDKTGLFRRLIERNAATVRSQLETSLAEGADPLATLNGLGPTLLNLLVSDRAIALNRAAASDTTGELGASLTSAGRNTIGPLIVQVFLAAREARQLQFNDPRAVVSRYLDLLVGDLQIRRAIGAVQALDDADIQKRAETAFSDLLLLLSRKML
jgi:AcrR family transcriptional regulator